MPAVQAEFEESQPLHTRPELDDMGTSQLPWCRGFGQRMPAATYTVRVTRSRTPGCARRWNSACCGELQLLPFEFAVVMELSTNAPALTNMRLRTRADLSHRPLQPAAHESALRCHGRPAYALQLRIQQLCAKSNQRRLQARTCAAGKLIVTISNCGRSRVDVSASCENGVTRIQ